MFTKCVIVAVVACALVSVEAGSQVKGPTPKDACSQCDSNARCLYVSMSTDASEFTMECACIEGYTGDGLTCTNRNECADQVDNCDTNAICLDSIGSFNCQCKPGFTGNGVSCSDLDECSILANPCNTANSQCRNFDGAYECVCNPGYEHPKASDGSPDLTKCIDIKECDTKDRCQANSICVELDGSYRCDCTTGFKLSANNTNVCENINECNGTLNLCNLNRSVCVDEIGGYRCECSSGYELLENSTTICVDVDECSLFDNLCLEADEHCHNTIGAFQCECDAGYDRDANGDCVDVNECQLGLDFCDRNRTQCIDKVGGYDCVCLPGYEYMVNSTIICVDVDECAAGTDNCSDYSYCVNTVGSFQCTCIHGYTGSGSSCVESSPSRAELQEMIKNNTKDQLVFLIQHAYHQMQTLIQHQELIKRYCDLSKVNKLPANRYKRELPTAEEIEDYTKSDSIEDLEYHLKLVRHQNSELSLQSHALKLECGLEDEGPLHLDMDILG